MELYWGNGSPNSWRVMLGLLFKDLDYDDHLLSLPDREHKQPGYTALNPRAKVPTLVDGEVVISESIAILAYLDHIVRRDPLFGAMGPDVARIWREVMEIEHYLDPAAQSVMRALAFNRWLHPIEDLRREVATVHKELDRLEANFLGGPFTAIDCLVVPILCCLRRVSTRAGASNIGLAPFRIETRWPRLGKRLAEVEALDGFGRTVPPSWG